MSHLNKPINVTVCLGRNFKHEVIKNRPYSFEGGIRPLDVGIILDQTVALGADEWTSVLDFLKRVVDGLGVSPAPNGTRIGLIQFSSRPLISLYFNTIRNEYLTSDTVNKFIDPITQLQGARRLDLALQSAATDLFSNKEGSRPNAKKVMET